MNYVISKIHLEGIHDVVELFPSFQKNYRNLIYLDCLCRRLNIPSIRFVQDLTEYSDWRHLFNEDYIVDTIDGIREIRCVHPYEYTTINKLIKNLENDKIENMIIVGTLAGCCVKEATKLFSSHMKVSVVKDAIFDELAYFPSACRSLKPYLITTKELSEKLLNERIVISF